jgi:hypothetical protein
MALTPGSKLGSYEILGFIGAEGMGEMYRARDSRLGREVALKILPRLLQLMPNGCDASSGKCGPCIHPPRGWLDSDLRRENY